MLRPWGEHAGWSSAWVGLVDVVARKRIIGGFFLLMMGFGLILDTPWDAFGLLVAATGAALVLWGVGARR